MKIKRTMLLISAAALLMPCTAAVDAAQGAADDSAEGSKAVFDENTRAQYVIYADREGTSISPYIFGICDNDSMYGLYPSAIKQADVALSAYNWESNYTDTGIPEPANDYSLVSNYAPSQRNTPGLCTHSLMTHADRYDVELRFATLQMMGRVAADANGKTDMEYDRHRWLDVHLIKNDIYTTRPDTTDGSVYSDEYVAYLVNYYGEAADGGVTGYFLDRAPDEWSTVFPNAGLNRLAPEKLARDSSRLASAIKTIDSTAMVLGPSLSTLSACVDLGNKEAWERTAEDSDYTWFIDFYLEHMKKSSEKYGARLLDALDVHYYTEALDPMGNMVRFSTDDTANAYRMQAVRTLWDSDYTENGYSALHYKQFTPFLPMLKAAVMMNYPGTPISVSEYDFGGGMNMSGAIAEIDALGTFAKEEIYLACLAPAEDYEFQKAALRMFTDYDGERSQFGDELLKIKGGDEYGSLWCAARDDGRLTAIVTSQNLEKLKDISIDIRSPKQYYVESAYCIDPDNAQIRRQDAELFNDETHSAAFTADTLSAYMLVFAEKPAEGSADATESEVSAGETETTVPDETTARETAAETGAQTKPQPGEESGTEEAVTAVTEVTQEPAETTAQTTVPAVEASLLYPRETAETDETVTKTDTDDEGFPQVPAFIKVITTMLAACASFLTVWVGIRRM